VRSELNVVGLLYHMVSLCFKKKLCHCRYSVRSLFPR